MTIKVGDKVRVTTDIFAKPFDKCSVHKVDRVKKWFSGRGMQYGVKNGSMSFHSSEVEKVDVEKAAQKINDFFDYEM